MNGKIFDGKNHLADLKNCDFYTTQNRITFKTPEKLEKNKKYAIILENREPLEVLITSAPETGDPTILIHGAILES